MNVMFEGFRHWTIRVGKNRLVYDEGESAKGCYRVESGCVRLQLNHDHGQRQIVAFCFPGDIFGLECDGPRLHAAEATMNSELTCFHLQAPERDEARDTGQVAFTNAACDMISRLSTHIKGLGVAAAEDRVMWFLDWVASDQKVCCTGGTVWLPMNRQDIADFLHLAPETLSRALSRLVRRSAIRVLEGHRIQLRPGSAVRPEPGRPTACASRLISPSSRDGVEASVK